jgi:hypothetical protein
MEQETCYRTTGNRKRGQLGAPILMAATGLRRSRCAAERGRGLSATRYGRLVAFYFPSQCQCHYYVLIDHGYSATWLFLVSDGELPEYAGICHGYNSHSHLQALHVVIVSFSMTHKHFVKPYSRKHLFLPEDTNYTQ